MKAKNPLTYDQAVKQIEDIVKDLETTEALSIDEYKSKAKKAKNLLDFCQKELQGMEKDLL